MSREVGWQVASGRGHANLQPATCNLLPANLLPSIVSRETIAVTAVSCRIAINYS